MTQDQFAKIPSVEVEVTNARDFLSDPETIALVDRYREECAKPPFDNSVPDLRAYEAMETVGAYGIAVLKKEGKAIGFVGVTVYTTPHFSLPVASIESIFLDVEHRKGANGLRLLNWAKWFARGKGAVGLTLTAVEGTRLEQLALRIARKTSHNFFMEV